MLSTVKEFIMPFSLPPNFKTDANELGKYVIEFETAVDDAKKDDYLRKAFAVGCRMLKTIDLDQLQERIKEVVASAEEYDLDWFAKIVEDEANFKYFLKNVESAVLDAAGIETRTRNRILKEIGLLQGTAVERYLEVTAASITHGIAELRRDVCLAKDQEIDASKRRSNHTRIVKTLCVIVILTDAVGSALFPAASLDTFAASIVVGGVGVSSAVAVSA